MGSFAAVTSALLCISILSPLEQILFLLLLNRLPVSEYHLNNFETTISLCAAIHSCCESKWFFEWLNAIVPAYNIKTG